MLVTSPLQSGCTNPCDSRLVLADSATVNDIPTIGSYQLLPKTASKQREHKLTTAKTCYACFPLFFSFIVFIFISCRFPSGDNACTASCDRQTCVARQAHLHCENDFAPVTPRGPRPPPHHTPPVALLTQIAPTVARKLQHRQNPISTACATEAVKLERARRFLPKVKTVLRMDPVPSYRNGTYRKLSLSPITL